MRCRSLRIEPRRPGDIHHKPSKAVGVLRRLQSRAEMPEVEFPETVFDRPLEEIIAALSQKANRPLG
jgi:hypothetical protein